jgi:hypothetical protein
MKRGWPQIYDDFADGWQFDDEDEEGWGFGFGVVKGRGSGSSVG